MHTEEPSMVADGFRIMLLRLLKDWNPTHMVVAMDSLSPSFRAKAYAEYKANRKDRTGPTPAELMAFVAPQLEAWGVQGIRVEGYEADDVMASLAHRGSAAGSQVSVASNDGDMHQIVSGNVRVLKPIPKGMEVVDEAWVMRKYGLSTGQLACVKALMGDASDNIPRVGIVKDGKSRGFTFKSACDLIQRFSSLEGVYESVSLLPDSQGAWLLACQERAFFFRDLVRLRYDVDLGGIDPRRSAVRNTRL
jgi:DNA polymerase-1